MLSIMRASGELAIDQAKEVFGPAGEWAALPEPTALAVREQMVRLERELGDGHPPLGEVAARMLGCAPGESFDRVLMSETGRTLMLCADWYGSRVAVLPSEQAIAVALVQGMTFAAAVRELVEGK